MLVLRVDAGAQTKNKSFHPEGNLARIMQCLVNRKVDICGIANIEQVKPVCFLRFSARLKPRPRKKQKRESDKTNDLTNWRVGAAFAALASWRVGVNGFVSSIEVGITGGD
jgi:hypothetical protein